MFPVRFVLMPFLFTLWSVAMSVNETTCVSDYINFVEQTFGNNSENRMKLYRAFYPPNGHLPYSVLVTYQTVLPNGTVLNISTDPSCSESQVWMWLSSPVLLFEEPRSLNRHMLFTLHLCEEWIPTHIHIICPYPCEDKAEEFLQEMTTSLQSCALGQVPGGHLKGYFAKDCGNNKFVFDNEIMAGVAVAGFIFLGIFVLFAPALLRDYVQEYILPGIEEEESPTYTYGIFWGFSATSCLFDGVALCSDINTLMVIFNDIGPAQQYLWTIGIALVLVLCIPASIYCGFSYELAIPDIYLRLAQCLCCDDRRARVVITSFTMWFNLVAVQLLLHHGVMIIHALPVAPFTIATNVMLLVLVGSCVIHINAAIFTCFASPKESCRNFTVVFLLIAIASFGVLLAYTTKYVNIATENMNYLTLIQSIFVPLLLGGMSLGVKKFMHWLSRQQNLHGTGQQVSKS